MTTNYSEQLDSLTTFNWLGDCQSRFPHRDKPNSDSSPAKKPLIDQNKLLSIITHDFKSPISSILDLTGLILNNPAEFSREEILQNLHNFETSLERVYQLIDNILSWATSQPYSSQLEQKSYSVDQLVAESIAIFAPLAAKKQTRIHSDVNVAGPLHGDHHSVGLVLRNLISNAIKFTPDSGSIFVSATQNKETLVIRVEDNGVGIPIEHYGKIFALDSRLSTLGTAGESGSGIGLSLCKEIVERNGGSLSFESREGKGTSFCLTLPIE